MNLKEEAVIRAMHENPTGLMVMLEMSKVTATFWQRPPPSERIFWRNFIHGILNNAIESKRLTVKDIGELLNEFSN